MIARSESTYDAVIVQQCQAHACHVMQCYLAELVKAVGRGWWRGLLETVEREERRGRGGRKEEDGGNYMRGERLRR